EESQQLSLAKNQLTVLDLWFVRCPPCVKDHKEIKKDVEDGLYQDKNLSFIGISRDRDFSLWQAYVEKHQLPWTNLNVEYTEGPNLIDELSISGFPTYLVLNDKGEILKTYNSYKQLRPFLLLQE
ncbi:MAG: TlpA disulfide reductase family protein, partial [Bacteroidota bacterium]